MLRSRRFVPLPLIALGALGGGALGLSTPVLGETPDAVVLAVVALATLIVLLPVPLVSFGKAVLERQFLLAVLGLNLIVAPLLVFVLSRVVVTDPDLQFGFILALLAPAVGVVVDVARRAGGAAEQLASLAPLLLLSQVVTLPGLMVLLGARDGILTISAPSLPFTVAAGILLPVLLAFLLQRTALARPRLGGAVRAGGALAVPATACAAGVVAAVFAPRSLERLPLLVEVSPLFAVYLILMAPIGILVGTAASLRIGQVRSLAFSGGARTGLLVLPIALAFPLEFSLVPLVVVTAMAVESIGLTVYRFVIPSVTQQSKGPLAQD